MRIISEPQFAQIIKDALIKPRFKRDLKYTLSTADLNNQAWSELELLPIWNKSRSGGILLLQPADNLYMLPFESGDTAYDATGRSKAAICDFCYTWQAAGRAGLTSFYPAQKSLDSTSFLCCKDLRCGDHVRTKTNAGLTSRTQLRENLDNDGRVSRLQARLLEMIERLQLEPVPA
jgi:hypothetical protein